MNNLLNYGRSYENRSATGFPYETTINSDEPYVLLDVDIIKIDFRELEIRIRNSIDDLKKETKSKEEILSAEFSLIKEKKNLEVTPRSHG